MSELGLALLALRNRLTESAVERFGSLGISEYQHLTPEKQQEFRQAVTEALAGEILFSSPFFRTCVRMWEIDEFTAQLSTAIRKTFQKIDEATDEYKESCSTQPPK
jgi:hypothetical protein